MQYAFMVLTISSVTCLLASQLIDWFSIRLLTCKPNIYNLFTTYPERLSD